MLKNASQVKGKVLLEYRSEQIWIDHQLKLSFDTMLDSSMMERRIVVSHPEVAPKEYATKVDNHFMLKGPDRMVSLCIDLHGTWHEKNKVQVRDENKRLALEYTGHHYVEICNYVGREECPTLWELMALMKEATKKVKPNVIQIYQTNIDKKTWQAQIEVSNQLLLQLALNHPRDVIPTGVLD